MAVQIEVQNEVVEVTPQEKQAAVEIHGGTLIVEGDGAVESVNGKTGAVVLTAEEVGARPNTWTPSASDVGAEPTGTAANKVSEHNTNTAAHNDIRLLIEGLTARLNALANSDDTTLDQMAEVVAYIKSNRTLIESVTTNKVDVANIINNLTTNVANKPLSAAQGVVLKGLIDALQTAVNAAAKAADLNSHTGNTTEHITAAERTKWNQAVTDVDGLREEIGNYLPKNQGAENVGMFVAVGSDGKLTLVEPPEGGLIGDVVGNLDESNNILLQGDIADGTYTLNWLRADGTIVDNAGSLIVSAIQTFAITKTLSNCTASGATEIRIGGSATVTITAKSGYTLPDSITVSGASYTWNKSNGQIILSNPTSDVAITVTAKAPAQPVTVDIGITQDYSIELEAGALRGSKSTAYCTTDWIELSNIPKPAVIELTGACWAYPNSSDTGYIRFFIARVNGEKRISGYTYKDFMPEGVTMVYNDDDRNNVTVTIDSGDNGKIRFAGLYGTAGNNSGTQNFADVKVTLTYTPTE